MKLERFLYDATSGRQIPCVVDVTQTGQSCVISVQVGNEDLANYRGDDFEESLQALRSDFESRGRLLLCNRFRRNAFVTSMSRQMSNGLRCYLVEFRKELDPAAMVDCLGPADVEDVVMESDALEFIDRWKSNPPWSARVPWLGRFLKR